MKIQQLKRFPAYSILTIFVVFTSCMKVIDVDLNSGNERFVVEGFVTEGETTHIVTITKTLNFDESTVFPGVDNAVVVITDNLGNTQTLTSIGGGQYQTSGYLGVSGRTYTTTITVDGKTFQASSTIPGVVEMDTLIVQQYTFGLALVNTLVPARFDPAGIANYYQFNLYDNGDRVSGIYLQDDQFTDGNYDLDPIFAGDYKSGDTALVEMYGIDKPVYKYFYALVSNDQGVTPANPTSNFTGGCLGYFSARTKQVKSVIIP